MFQQLILNCRQGEIIMANYCMFILKQMCVVYITEDHVSDPPSVQTMSEILEWLLNNNGVEN
jgi:hypothetical protein